MKPGLFGGLCGQFARSGIERCRNGEDDLLGIEIAFSRNLPRAGQMPEISRRRFDRRYALDFRRRLPRQQSTGSIHAGVAQPALRRCRPVAWAPLRRGARANSPAAYDCFLSHGTARDAVGELSFLGEIYKGWQQRVALRRYPARSIAEWERRLPSHRTNHETRERSS